MSRGRPTRTNPDCESRSPSFFIKKPDLPLLRPRQLQLRKLFHGKHVCKQPLSSSKSYRQSLQELSNLERSSLAAVHDADVVEENGLRHPELSAVGVLVLALELG